VSTTGALVLSTVSVCRMHIADTGRMSTTSAWGLSAAGRWDVRKFRQRLAFLPVSKVHTNKIYIFRQCTYIVYMCGDKAFDLYPFRQYYLTMMQYFDSKKKTSDDCFSYTTDVPSHISNNISS
jgi:hypothetical protein